jgi:hypothetical protein
MSLLQPVSVDGFDDLPKQRTDSPDQMAGHSPVLIIESLGVQRRDSLRQD